MSPIPALKQSIKALEKINGSVRQPEVWSPYVERQRGAMMGYAMESQLLRYGQQTFVINGPEYEKLYKKGGGERKIPEEGYHVTSAWALFAMIMGNTNRELRPPADINVITSRHKVIPEFMRQVIQSNVHEFLWSGSNVA